jgi:long-chain acyl-CoA synthetase
MRDEQRKPMPGTFETGAKNLCRMLEDSADRFGDRPALIFLDKVIPYNELRQKVHFMAAALQKIGIEKGDRVAIMLPNSPQLVIAYYAALNSGAVVVMCNPLYTPRELKIQLEQSDTKLLVTLDLFWPKAREVKESGVVKQVILTTLAPYLHGLKKLLYPVMRRFKADIHFAHREDVYFFEELLEEYPGPGHAEAEQRCGSLQELAMIQFTGGTTGIPQGAMLTHFNLLRNALQVARWFPELEIGNERMLAVLPFFHIFGLTVCLNMTILAGGVLILVPRFSYKTVKSLLRTIEKHKPTLFPAVPTIYAALTGFKHIKSYDLSSIKFCISGAAPLPGPLQKTFQQLTGAVLVEGYGLSEASPVTHCNPLDKEKNKIGSIGLPLSETSARIVDLKTGNDLPPNQVGELVVRGPQVMRGYWKKEAETTRALRDGWLYTGDLARKDEDGYFYIVDRIKELIIVGGLNVYPGEVEEVLYSHPKIAETAVVGVPHEYKGEAVKAYVVLKPGAKITAAEIRDYCREFMSPYKVPKYIEFQDKLPRSIIGKILKKKLREKPTTDQE